MNKFSNKEAIELLKRATNGCVSSSSSLFKILSPYIIKVLKSKGFREDDLDDILQESFIKIFRSGNNFNPKKASVAKWASVIAHRRAIDFCRHRNRLNNHFVSIPDYEDHFSIDSKSNENQYDSICLNKALLVLSEKERELLQLRFGFNLQLNEISDLLGITNNTLKTRSRRIFSKIRESYKNQERLIEV